MLLYLENSQTVVVALADTVLPIALKDHLLPCQLIAAHVANQLPLAELSYTHTIGQF